MVLYLYNRKNLILATVEITDKGDFVDLISSVNIKEYSKLLVECVILDKNTEILVDDFTFLSELRGWFFEYYSKEGKVINYNQVVKDIMEILAKICYKYDLYVLPENSMKKQNSQYINKIFIPSIAKTFTDDGTFYVSFPYEMEDVFHKWCNDNNIGWDKTNRKDITKSDCAVFTDLANKSIFI